MFKNKFDLNQRVVLIGFLHAVILVYAVFQITRNLILKQQPVTENQIINIVLHVVFQVFLIITLIRGAKTKKPLLLLPWLIVTFPIFAVMSYYILQYSHLNYLSQLIFNIFFISFGWFLWLTVLHLYRSCSRTDTFDAKT